MSPTDDRATSGDGGVIDSKQLTGREAGPFWDTLSSERVVIVTRASKPGR